MAAVFLCGTTGGLSTPTRAAVGGPCVGGGSGTTTFTCSTTAHTTYTVSGGGTFGVGECPFVGNACPLGTTPQINHTETSVTTSVATGPGTIMIEACQLQTFLVAAGTSNVNTNTHTETFVDCLAAAPNAVPTLSEWAFLGMALLLTGFGVWQIAYRRRS